jgi:hypothetical protein
LHDSALHGGEDENSQPVKVGPGRKAFPRLFQKTADRAGPSRKVRRDAPMRGQVLGFNFESQPSDGASIPAPGRGKAFAIPLKNAEDALQRIGESDLSRLDDDRIQPFQIAIQ